MTRSSQNFLLLLLGGTLLWITVITGEFVNYVKPELQIPLVLCAVVVIGLGATGLRRDWNTVEGSDGCRQTHNHAAPRVAWLLCLPVLVIFAVAPPELGEFTASRTSGRAAPQASEYSLPTGTDPVDMSVAEFLGRSADALAGGDQSLRGRKVSLIGFVSPDTPRGWSLTRLQMGCCAGDAIALQVRVKGVAPPAKGVWVDVIGVWPGTRSPESEAGYSAEIEADSVAVIPKPANPYE
ncbi:TIGR03943 family putative permease subunit [Streptomyces wuyuanensis]|uniref:TIGR03943 family putative permease subunit n=1 Tax=Streptomyces wuyuanensis TaxID=1196353 RepID=UPI0034373756